MSIITKKHLMNGLYLADRKSVPNGVHYGLFTVENSLLTTSVMYLRYRSLSGP